MSRHKWTKKGIGRFVYWECLKCRCTKQKDWGYPWFYFLADAELPVLKSPQCITNIKDK